MAPIPRRLVPRGSTLADGLRALTNIAPGATGAPWDMYRTPRTTRGEMALIPTPTTLLALSARGG